MKQLEKKIIKKVFRYEIKRISFELILRTISLGLVGFFSVLMLTSLIQQLIDQKTFDLFQLFNEDMEAIITHIDDVFETLGYEIPFDLVFLSIICLVILFILIVLVIQNYKRMMNTLCSIIKLLKKNFPL